jgi:hypothetical protein
MPLTPAELGGTMMFAVKLFGAVLASFVGLSVAVSEKFNPYTRVTLVAYLCNGVTCIHEPVPPKMMVAGKVEDYLGGNGIPMPYNYVLCKYQGFNDASQCLFKSRNTTAGCCTECSAFQAITRTPIRHSFSAIDLINLTVRSLC